MLFARLVWVSVDGQNFSSGSSSSFLSSEVELMLRVLFSFVVFSASNHIYCNYPETSELHNVVSQWHNNDERNIFLWMLIGKYDGSCAI